MNIQLIPYNWTRHFSIGLFVAGTATIAWWCALNWLIIFNSSVAPTYQDEKGAMVMDQFYEGIFLMVCLSIAVGPPAILAEGMLRRRAPHWIGLQMFIALLFGAGFSGLIVFGFDYTLYSIGMAYEKVDEIGVPIFGGPATAALKYKISVWIATGAATGFGVYLARMFWFLALKLRAKFEEKIPDILALPDEYAVLPSFYNHVVGGLCSGMIAAAIWHIVSYQIVGDFYVASALGFLVMGFMFGTLTWGIPPDLYTGWLRVLSHHRYGHRLPVLGENADFSEKFVGHFPRGLDMFVEHEHGVAEIHASFVGEKSGRYAVRGLTQSPTHVKRFLERLNLTYDPHSPVPLEADLRMEDVVILGVPGAATHVEFLLLPKEEA